MKRLKSEEALEILDDMKVKIEIPKAAVMQYKRNAALDMAIEALKCSEIPNCSDCISRQAAIDALYTEIIKRRLMDDVNDGMLDEFDTESVLRKLPSAEPEPKWIPCSERLPETSGTYLVSGMWESGRVAVGDCEYTSYDGYFNTAWNFDVLAWMPLPEPYREE